MGVPEHGQEIYVTSSDAFALKNSNLNPFLFADVGTETNGSALTILSVLARLGQDPWAEAARWTALPKAAAIDCLASSINKMPLDPLSLSERTATAAQLILLLPAQTQAPGQTIRAAVTASAMPNWIPIAFLCISLVITLAFSLTSAPVAPDGAATPVAQTIDHAAPVTPR
jgi:hypothetical protein